MPRCRRRRQATVDHSCSPRKVRPVRRLRVGVCTRWKAANDCRAQREGSNSGQGWDLLDGGGGAGVCWMAAEEAASSLVPFGLYAGLNPPSRSRIKWSAGSGVSMPLVVALQSCDKSPQVDIAAGRLAGRLRSYAFCICCCAVRRWARGYCVQRCYVGEVQ